MNHIIRIIIALVTCDAVRISNTATFLSWRPTPKWVTFTMPVDLATTPFVPKLDSAKPAETSFDKSCRDCRYCEVDKASGWAQCVLFPVASVKIIPGQQLPSITIDNALCTDARANASQCGREGRDFAPKP